eukprot:Hpha_TRINITY_DN20606_c0_g1::TRINITY_DN20606_c0_g1_i1::g.148052::m.148052
MPSAASPRQPTRRMVDPNEAKYEHAVVRLRESGLDKGKLNSPPMVVSALQAMCLLRGQLKPELVPLLQPLLRSERRDVQSLYLLVLWLILSKGGGAKACEQLATAVQQHMWTIQAPEVRRTSLSVLHVLNLMQRVNSQFALRLNPKFAESLLEDLKKALEAKSKEKRGLTTKVSVYHEEKKIRLQAHLAGLALFTHVFPIHVLPALFGRSGTQWPSIESTVRLLCQTAIEYSYKEKEVPVVREALAALSKVEQVCPGVLGAVAEHLPTHAELLSARPPERGAKKERKGKEAGFFPLWDPLAAAALVKMCLTVLQSQGRESGRSSPFHRCLVLLVHHPDKYVFSEVVWGLIKGSGLFHILLEPDTLYGSREKLMDYVVETRIKSMVMGTSHTECYAGLRMAQAVCERVLEAAGKDARSGVLQIARNSFARFEAAAANCRDRFAYDPMVTVQALQTQLWLTAVLLAEGAEGGALMVRRLLTELVTAISTSPAATSAPTLTLLRNTVRALKAINPGRARTLMGRAFIGLISYLAKRCCAKLSVLGLQGLLQDYLLEGDLVAPPEPPGAPPCQGPVDVDPLPHQRGCGGLGTLELVLTLLDGGLTPEAANAEE